MKKVAILIDGEWFRIALIRHFGSTLTLGVTADLLYRNALLAVETASEELLRIFYYDCEPHQGHARNPISKLNVPCTTPAKADARRRFFNELGQMPLVALRRGTLHRRSWGLRLGYIKKLLKGAPPQPLTANDVTLTMTQKGVDMRIGIDVASLTLKRHVDRIILISGDMDMIPAMKLARREGVQVVMIEFPEQNISKELIEDADFVRTIVPTL